MNKQSGNVLIFILIAIFLLGGLTAMLARSGGNTEETGSAERASIQISSFIRYAASLQSAVQNLIMHGCSEGELSFETPLQNLYWGATTRYNNPNAPTDKSCHIFEPQGAGLSFKTNTSLFPGGVWQGTAAPYNDFVIKSDIVGIGTNGTAQSGDLIWIVELPSNIDRAGFCTQMNRALGYNEASVGSAGVWGSPGYDGTFPPITTLGGAIANKKAYCHSYYSEPTRHMLYFVLLPR